MNLTDKIRQMILSFLRLDKLTYNPTSDRLTYINDDKRLIQRKVDEYRNWYIGEASELLNFYTNQEIWGNASDPIYSRNVANYFWGLASMEGDIKRVHSGVPNAIVTTLVNAIGNPEVEASDPTDNEVLKKIIEENDMINMVNQKQVPLTLVEGWGAFKINFDKRLSDYPMIQYYEADSVEFVYKSGVLIGIIYKDFYQYKNKNYLLLETRRRLDGDSIIEYKLFKLHNKGDVDEVPLETIPELVNLKEIKIEGYNKVLGVPSKFFFDPLNKDYGRSIYAGKVTLFDMLDENLSQNSQTVRVSTPVEYYPVDTLQTSPDGRPLAPKLYNRQFVKVDSIPNGDGEKNSQITTTQPILNFQQYNDNAKHILDMILTGILSPATMGIDVAKKDNAEAQREKEKVTIMTRNNVIDREEKELKQLYSMCLDIYEFMHSGKITLKDREISVKFDEFANPSFESELQTLAPAWASGAISTEKYVDLLWGDSLTDEEKAFEIQKLNESRQQDSLELGDFGNADSSQFYSGSEEPKTEQIEEAQEQLR